jgi:hypothetical protein
MDEKKNVNYKEAQGDRQARADEKVTTVGDEPSCKCCGGRREEK